MKIIDIKPGEQALCLNKNEILETSTVAEAYTHFGATPRRARQLAEEFFFAVESLVVERRELRRKRQEQGRRLGLARAEQLRQQRTPKA